MIKKQPVAKTAMVGYEHLSFAHCIWKDCQIGICGVCLFYCDCCAHPNSRLFTQISLVCYVETCGLIANKNRIRNRRGIIKKNRHAFILHMSKYFCFGKIMTFVVSYFSSTIVLWYCLYRTSLKRFRLDSPHSACIAHSQCVELFSPAIVTRFQ